MNQNLVIVGSRGRPANVVRAFEHIKKHSVESDFMLIINEDQDDIYPQIDGVERLVVPAELGTTSTAKVNYLATLDYIDKYSTITGVDDDVIVATPEWDAYLTFPLKQKGYGLSYGNDTIQGQRLPTKWTLTSNIIKALGFVAPPGLIHLFVDNFLGMVGASLQASFYFEDVILEHHHFINGKAEMDDTYKENNTQEVWDHDRKVFQDYLLKQFEIDMVRVKKALGIIE